MELPNNEMTATLSSLDTQVNVMDEKHEESDIVRELLLLFLYSDAFKCEVSLCY